MSDNSTSWKPSVDSLGRTRRTARGSGTSATPPPFYPDVATWVEVHFVPMFRRTLGGEFRWCARWFDHAEAISRLTALWYSWEAMRLQGGAGLGLWYRDHLDHQLPILMGARGPFYQCSEREHYEPHLARVEAVPLERRASLGAPHRGDV